MKRGYKETTFFFRFLDDKSTKLNPVSTLFLTISLKTVSTQNKNRQRERSALGSASSRSI